MVGVPKIVRIRPTVKECNYNSTPSFVTDMDLISTRSIWLQPCTVLEITGESGGLLLNIGWILKIN